MNKSPAFQFYVKDFLTDDKVVVMNMEARGVYITLLCFCWNNNGLTNDQEGLKEMCGNPVNWEKIWGKVGKCFYVKGEKLFNKRLDKEAMKQKKWKEKSSKGGKESAKVRWGDRGNNKGGYKKVKTKTKPLGNSSSPSSSSTSLLNNKEDIYSIIKHWNSQKIKSLEDRESNIRRKTLPKIQKQLKDYSVEEISEAISNYSTILKEDKYFFSYSWQLWEFLDRGLVNFLTKNNPSKNYLSDKDKSIIKDEQRKKKLDDWTKKPLED